MGQFKHDQNVLVDFLLKKNCAWISNYHMEWCSAAGVSKVLLMSNPPFVYFYSFTVWKSTAIPSCTVNVFSYLAEIRSSEAGQKMRKCSGMGKKSWKRRVPQQLLESDPLLLIKDRENRRLLTPLIRTQSPTETLCLPKDSLSKRVNK